MFIVIKTQEERELHNLECAMAEFACSYSGNRGFKRDRKFLLNAYADYNMIIENCGGIEELRRDLKNFRASFCKEAEAINNENWIQRTKFYAVSNYLRDTHRLHI